MGSDASNLVGKINARSNPQDAEFDVFNYLFKKVKPSWDEAANIERIEDKYIHISASLLRHEAAVKAAFVKVRANMPMALAFKAQAKYECEMSAFFHYSTL